MPNYWQRECYIFAFGAYVCCGYVPLMFGEWMMKFQWWLEYAKESLCNLLGELQNNLLNDTRRILTMFLWRRTELFRISEYWSKSVIISHVYTVEPRIYVKEPIKRTWTPLLRIMSRISAGDPGVEKNDFSGEKQCLLLHLLCLRNLSNPQSHAFRRVKLLILCSVLNSKEKNINLFRLISMCVCVCPDQRALIKISVNLYKHN